LVNSVELALARQVLLASGSQWFASATGPEGLMDRAGTAGRTGRVNWTPFTLYKEVPLPGFESPNTRAKKFPVLSWYPATHS
jgi:hypothetical protein